MSIKNTDKELILTNIQRMCFHDGPGIRTTVFLKGCNLHCPWCSNPENISFCIEEYNGKHVKGVYGKRYTPLDLYNTLIKDVIFWGDDGGVTFSGGEPLMQPDSLKEILKLLKGQNIHTALETALFVTLDNLIKIKDYIDYFIVDIKIMDYEMCKEVLGGYLDRYIENIDYLYSHNKISMFRIPCNYEYTLTKDNTSKIVKFLEKHPHVPVQIFAVHNLGEQKYQSLGKEPWKYKKVEENDLEILRSDLNDSDIDVEIISI